MHPHNTPGSIPIGQSDRCHVNPSGIKLLPVVNQRNINPTHIRRFTMYNFKIRTLRLPIVVLHCARLRNTHRMTMLAQILQNKGILHFYHTQNIWCNAINHLRHVFQLALISLRVPLIGRRWQKLRIVVGAIHCIKQILQIVKRHTETSIIALLMVRRSLGFTCPIFIDGH